MSKNHPKTYTKLSNGGYGYKHRDLALLKTRPRYWQKGLVKRRQKSCYTNGDSSKRVHSFIQITCVQQDNWPNRKSSRTLLFTKNLLFIHVHISNYITYDYREKQIISLTPYKPKLISLYYAWKPQSQLCKLYTHFFFFWIYFSFFFLK